jgi:hypothetical protein|tara:strand:- start:1993 stop:2703 length:711 start_codon:yes stop_codon:yes gene_type:complete
MNKVNIKKGIECLDVEILSWNPDSQMISYKITGTPVCQYDQHSRARVGIKFKDYEVSKEPNYVVYTQVWDTMEKDPEFKKEVIETLQELEDIRNESSEDLSSIEMSSLNLMSRECSYVVEQNIGSLRGQMARRLQFCEEEFIVGLHWLLRQKMIDKGISMAEGFKPMCDVTKKCEYAKADYLSNAFGCLFAGCGRWKSHTEFASFNQSCTTPELVKEQTGVTCTKSEYELQLEKES